MTKNLADRFLLKLLSDGETYVLEHGGRDWINFPRRHIGDLHRLIAREVGENSEEE